MKAYLKEIIKNKSGLRWILGGIYNSPFSFWSAIARSFAANKKITGKFIPLKVRVGNGQKIKILKGRGTEVKLLGLLYINSWNGNSALSSLVLGDNSKLEIEGDFEIGPNVHISLADCAELRIGGVKESSGSGITCDTIVMVERELSVGFDSIIAWGCFITDSDWHYIDGCSRFLPTSIGDKVWISHGVSILKGGCVPSGSIVGAKSIVSSRFDAENSLIAGNPAYIRKQGVKWKR